MDSKIDWKYSIESTSTKNMKNLEFVKIDDILKELWVVVHKSLDYKKN